MQPDLCRKCARSQKTRRILGRDHLPFRDDADAKHCGRPRVNPVDSLGTGQCLDRTLANAAHIRPCVAAPRLVLIFRVFTRSPPRRGLAILAGLRGPGEDDFVTRLDHLPGESVRAAFLTDGVATVDSDIAALDPPKLAEGLLECRQPSDLLRVALSASDLYGDPPQLFRRLRPRAASGHGAAPPSRAMNLGRSIDHLAAGEQHGGTSRPNLPSICRFISRRNSGVVTPPASPSADNAWSVERCADYGTSAKIGSPFKYSAGPHLQGPAEFGERTHDQVFGSSWNVCQLHKVNVPLTTG
jgi:hypothetical protein